MKEDDVSKACVFIKNQVETIPEIAIVLGSGLGNFVDMVDVVHAIPYGEIPGFPVSTAPGHASRLVFGRINGLDLIILQGRFHFYEGYSMDQITFYVRVLKELGLRTLILTNASGGVNRSFNPGDLMLLSDHINLTGQNPLIGPNDDSLGLRFPDLTRAYTPRLRQLAKDAAAGLGMTLQEGVYAWMTGPSYETPAEIRMLDIIGADSIGMSTVPEVIAAVHSGLEVLAISCITNMAAGVLDQPITAEEVMEIGAEKAPEFAALVSRIIELYYENSTAV